MGSNAKLPREQFLTKRQMFLIEMVKRVLQERFDITGEMLQWTMKRERHLGTEGWCDGAGWKYEAIVRHRPYSLEVETASLDSASVTGRVFGAPKCSPDRKVLFCTFEVWVKPTGGFGWSPSGPTHLEVSCTVKGGVLSVRD